MGVAEQQISSLGIVIRDPRHAFLADRALLGFDHAIGLLSLANIILNAYN